MLLAPFFAVTQAQAPSFPSSDPLPPRFGQIVALCGDLDGDGRSEFAIGGAYWNDEDSAIVIYGGRYGGVFRRIAAVGPNEFIGAGGYGGSGFCCTHDLDGDHVNDMAVPIWAVAGKACRVEIRSGKSGKVVRSLAALDDEHYLGAGVADIGDVDKDGVSDLVVSAFHSASEDDWKGMRWIVVSGATCKRVRTVEWEGPRDRDWNMSLENPSATPLGDVDGDGVPDFAIVDGLRVRVESGSEAKTLHTFSMPAPQGKNSFRMSVLGPGDLDHDGHAEIVIGTPGPGGDGKDALQIYVRIYSGSDGHLVTPVKRPGKRYGSGFGLCAGRDFNDDGVPDLWVTTHDWFGAALSIVSGRDGSELKLVCSGWMNDFGWAVESGADVDGDGIADVIVGAYSPFDGGIPSSGGYVYSGKDGHVLWERIRDPIKAAKDRTLPR